MKKIFEYIGFVFLICLTFLYYQKVGYIIRNNDSLFKTINKLKLNYEVKSIDPIIKDDTIILGQHGKFVDINKSYNNMKKINRFNEDLLVYKETKLNKLINNKYIIKANKNIGLIFHIKEQDNLTKILSILNKYNINAAFYIEKNWIKQNKINFFNLIKTKNLIITDNQFLNFLIKIKTKQKNNYCLTKEKNDNILKKCKKSHIILPNIIIKNNPLFEIKSKFENGSLILLEDNLKTINDLPYIIEYIKSKGLKVLNIEELFNE